MVALDARLLGHPALAWQGARVLLADDDPVCQAVAAALLESWGLSVELADDGEQALLAATAEDFDLILLDLQMPHLGGLEACRLMRALPALAHTPIVAMTGSDLGEVRAQAQAVGMSDFVLKPLEPARLQDLLSRVL